MHETDSEGEDGTNIKRQKAEKKKLPKYGQKFLGSTFKVLVAPLLPQREATSAYPVLILTMCQTKMKALSASLLA